MTGVPHGHAATSNSQGDRSPMTSNASAKMSSTLVRDIAQLSHTRPSIQSQHSSSMPSTPYQQPRELSFPRRSPSPTGNNASTSPRSTQSESGQPLPSARRPFGACRYESGMAFSKRRVPYALGTDKLGEEKKPLKAHLEPEEDDKISGDMRVLYDRLFPSSGIEKKRKDFVKKLERILNEQWPGHVIRVNVFGSTGNNLSTNESDVDICITTDFKDLEHVCILADLLAKRGMQRVVCVSSAKVPIVKIWDPDLELACDMNVNNPMALENTRMIKTYVQIDERARALAVIVKYWTKRRILNDAALGGTLSSYTWICLIVHFLQNRSPPILPALQQRPTLKKVKVDGLDVSFDDNLESLCGFGADNKESLGELLFQFFRYYGHEIDYEQNVISVRQGKLIAKAEKGWHHLQNNRLCVEEPFNTSRNLGNTADDTSFRGIHLELRRAFDLLCDGDLQKCCEQYEYPAEDGGRVFERPVHSRPVQVQSAPLGGRGGRGGGRGGRGAYNRGGSNPSTRRASSASTRGQNMRWSNYGVTPQEMSLQAQQQQYMLHDHLYQQFQILQQQEQELRMQLQQQTLHQPRHLLLYPHLQFPQPSHDGMHEENVRARAGTVNHPPLTAPIRPNGFAYGSPLMHTMTMPHMQGRSTNPPSPSLASAVPERPSFRRTSTATGMSGGSLRAQSQPARPISTQLPMPKPPSNHLESQKTSAQSLAQNRRTSPSSPKQERERDTSYFPSSGPTLPAQAFERRPSEYIGYYVGGSPSLQPYPQSAFVSPLLGPSGLAIRNGGVSPYLVASGYDCGSPTRSPPPEPLELSAKASTRSNLTLQARKPQLDASGSTRDPGPLIIDGSQLSNESVETTKPSTDSTMAMSLSTSASDDAFTPTTSDATSQDLPDSLPLDSEYHGGPFAQPLPEFSTRSSSNGREGLGIFNSEPSEQNRLRTGSIPAQLTIQTANGEMTNGLGIVAQDQSKAYGYDKFTNSVAELGFNQAANGIPDAKQVSIQSPGPLLSPVKEVRTPSPSTKRRSAITESERPNGAMHKTKSESKADKQTGTISSPQDIPKPRPEALASKPNGAPNGFTPMIPNGAPVPNGWQTQKKKKGHLKRASANDIGSVAVPGGQILPLDESLRKGG